MTTRIRIPSRTRIESRIELDPAEFEAFGLESGERAATGGLPAGPGRELSPGLIDEAVDRARVRSMVELPDAGVLSDEVIDELLQGARTEEEIAGPAGCSRS